jgi:hypothetical protein
MTRHLPVLVLATVLSLSLAGCAGFRGGWESVPYVGDAPPQLQEARTPHESRERTKLNLEALVLGVSLNNQVRTYDTQVYGFVVPLSVDLRTVQTARIEPGRTRVTLQISGLAANFEFRPRMAKLSIGDRVADGETAFEFGMWDSAGQRVASGGRWEDRAIGDSLVLQDRSRVYLLSIDFPLEPPSPESRAISLDLSRALVAPNGAGLPVIRFTPGKWRHGYT